MPFFFKRKQDSGPSGETGEISWATNAPAHWPQVVGSVIAAPHAAVHTISFSAILIRALAADDDGPRFAGLSETILCEDGALEIPYVVVDEDLRISVFSYPESSRESASHFAAVRKLLRERGDPDPVWYAPEPLPEIDDDTASTDVLEPFDFHLLGYLEEWNPPAGDWAMWWTSDDDVPADGETFDWREVASLSDIGRAYRGFERVYSYAFSGLVKSLELIDDESAGPRIALPDELKVFPVRGPEETELLVSASAEKGIRFHFHTEKTPPRVRDLYWRNLAHLADRLIEEATRFAVPLDDEPADPELSPLGWWQLTEKTFDSELGDTEPSGGPWKLGVIPIE